MNFYSLLADLILILHASFIGFVIFGLVLIVTGLLRRWRWVLNFWFRLSHLLAIGIVIVQSWLGIICPLTIWEQRLRMMGEVDSYSEGFVAYWLHRIIFYQAEPWVFSLVYTVFGACVLITWIWGRPQSPSILIWEQSCIHKFKMACKRL